MNLSRSNAAVAPTAPAIEPPGAAAARDEEAEAQRTWALGLVDSAKQPRGGKRSERANAAREVVQQGVIALRALWKQGAPPDPMGAVYLDALLESLERIAEGEDPRAALHLDAGGRVVHDNQILIDWVLLESVGRAADKLRVPGAKRAGFGQGVAVIDRAKLATAKEHDIDRTVVDAAWKAFGSMRGWDKVKARRRAQRRKHGAKDPAQPTRRARTVRVAVENEDGSWGVAVRKNERE